MLCNSFQNSHLDLQVLSFVLIMGEEGSHYLGYLEDLYEDKNGEKMVNVQWFQFREEVISMIPHVHILEKFSSHLISRRSV